MRLGGGQKSRDEYELPEASYLILQSRRLRITLQRNQWGEELGAFGDEDENDVCSTRVQSRPAGPSGSQIYARALFGIVGVNYSKTRLGVKDAFRTPLAL